MKENPWETGSHSGGQKFTAFFWLWKFITMLTRCVTWSRWIRSIPSHSISLRSIYILLSFHLCQCLLLNDLHFPGFSIKGGGYLSSFTCVLQAWIMLKVTNMCYFKILKCTLCLAGVAMRWQCGDSTLLSCWPPLPQILALLVPRGSWWGAVL